ncbi:NAD(P)/FAD-dependent oxidoreductase [Arthrobacter sp. NPDC058130]|uniref:NAD(P)/FAD-dependent oxidoreductase n=1 Tax=Arthrobacter sp. NPDC058130 TaxID=3346353 RepID=UPI0036E61A94
MSSRRVVIIGAGYAGVMAANRLAGSKQLGDLQVTVVNPVADFVERIRLHEVAAGSRASAAVPIRSVLGGRADFIEDSASRIDPDNRQVHFSSGRAPLGYDGLLYAVGSGHVSSGVPAGAYGFGDAKSAVRLRARLSQLGEGAAVSIVGAGLTGVELVAEIAERYPLLRARLVSRGIIGGDLSRSGQRAVRNRLAALGVEMLENTGVQRCDDSTFTTAGGVTLHSDCTVWTAGFSVPDLARDSGLPTDAEGRLIVDESLSCPDYPEIFGAGDAVRVPDSVGSHLRMSCASALPLGAHAADNIIARLQNRSPAALSAGYVFRCISLGRKAGLIQTVTADDRPRPFVVGGRLAGLAKEQVCRLTLSWIRGELRRSGSFTWPKGPLPADVAMPVEAR